MLQNNQARALRREGSPAAAALLRIRILKNEPGLHQRFLVIEREAVEIENTFRIDEDLNAIEIEHLVLRPRLRVELELIAQSRAPAAENAQTQPALRPHLFKRGANFS